MSITDELREQLLYHEPASLGCLNGIADHIDEKHERTKRNLTDALRMQEAATRELSEKSVLLPRDGNGEYIHIGDVMDNTHKRGFAAKTVIGISYHEGGKMCVRVDEDELRWHDPLKLHHHHEPTAQELKPCPFCGSKTLYEVYHALDQFTQPMVFCNGCKALFTVEGSEDWVSFKTDGMDRLRAAWNRRTNDRD